MQPNLFLLGLPKCGTSTFFDQLCKHSAIEGTNPKETFQLLDEDSELITLKKHDSWKHVMPHSSDQVSYVLEGSTHTIFQKMAPEYFKRNPEVKGIIVLRDPVKRIYSSFNFTKYNLNSINPIISFDAYVNDLLADADFQYIKNEVSRFVLSHELYYSKYDYVLQSWQSLIKEGRVKIIIFEALIDSPEDIYRDLFNWLAITQEKIWETKAKNTTLQPKKEWLHQLAVIVNKKVYNWRVFQPIKKLYKSNMTKVHHATEEDLKAMNKLRGALNDSIENLNRQFGIDTSYWK
ncbi:sulfotransferase domain-containing protein [Marivirga sp. S37H4]|uniref:Sulfotransferase domain-containing protein n=1 Tax=Marivirga aurantiaca TaxID=2802615 RepID=A0A934WXB4_9BACT|nr:sulfotransferase domain-containing protein [Marivirga aurantiaca]